MQIIDFGFARSFEEGEAGPGVWKEWAAGGAGDEDQSWRAGCSVCRLFADNRSGCVSK